MTRAELLPDGKTYRVFPPERVGAVETLFDRLSHLAPPAATILLGLDFPIGLPRAYATTAGLREGGFRKALALLGGEGPWRRFYEISANPEITSPFYPPPTNVKGLYSKRALVNALKQNSTNDLLRHCDLRTAIRLAAESLFFTLGGKQVGPSVIEGWSKLLAPALDRIRMWPFDGELSALVAKPGIVVAEIYPGEAYSHLGLTNGIGRKLGRKLSKRRREDRKLVSPAILSQASSQLEISSSAKTCIESGFLEEDDFDATVGLFSMLQVVNGGRAANVPDDPDVRLIEGWILGQEALAVLPAKRSASGRG